MPGGAGGMGPNGVAAGSACFPTQGGSWDDSAHTPSPYTPPAAGRTPWGGSCTTDEASLHGGALCHSRLARLVPADWRHFAP
jgi:hypothetical protein